MTGFTGTTSNKILRENYVSQRINYNESFRKMKKMY